MATDTQGEFHAVYPVVSVGVDYLTVTGVESRLPGELHSQATALFQSQAAKGNQIKAWGLAGFSGFSCGGVQIGKRDRDVIVRLSSGVAQSSWRKIYETGANCSRVDSQVTIQVAGDPTGLIDEVLEEARDYSTSKRNKPIVRWTQEHTGGYTVYVGSRKSNCFGRVYDKGRESHLREYDGCVRFEVQFQNELANIVAGRMFSAQSEIPVIVSDCRQFFRSRGIAPRWYYTAGATYGCTRLSSDVDKNLRWLAAAVRPCLRRLMDAGYGEAAFKSLGIITDDGPPLDHEQ